MRGTEISCVIFPLVIDPAEKNCFQLLQADLVEMPTDIRISILGSPGSGRTTLCHRLDEYAYIRLSDGRRFRFLAQEADMNASELMNESDAILLTFGLDTKFWDLITQYGKLVRDKYWEQRKAFHIVGTKQDSLEQDSDYVKYPGGLTTRITLFSSVDSAIVSALSGNGMEELCCSVVTTTQRDEVDQVHPVGPTTGSRIHQIFERIRSWALDVIAFTFSLPVPTDINKDTPDSDDLPTIPDDDTAWEMIKTPEAVAYNKRLAASANSIINCAPTFKIAPTLILKRLDPFERFSNIFVRSHTTIPVPQPRYLHLKEVLITDFIPGSMLLECWDSLSAFYQFRIACTLRMYVSQMRRITRDRPGNIERGHVKGHLFEPDLWNGPFRDVETFRNWIAHIAYINWISACEDFRMFNPGLTPPYPEPDFPPTCDWTPVLTHCDLSVGNVMLSDSGVLWVIDWAESGFYPSWLESLGMSSYDKAPHSWKRWYTFIVGSSSELDGIWSQFIRNVAKSASEVPRQEYWPPSI